MKKNCHPISARIVDAARRSDTAAQNAAHTDKERAYHKGAATALWTTAQQVERDLSELERLHYWHALIQHDCDDSDQYSVKCMKCDLERIMDVLGGWVPGSQR
jgi:hypothetical protein